MSDPVSPAIKAAILDLVRNGLNDTVVSRRVGFSRDVVRRIRLAEGLPGNKQTFKIPRDELRARHAEGLTDAQLAAHFGASVNGVSRARIALGLVVNRAPYKPQPRRVDEARLRKMHAEGASDAAMADVFGVSKKFLGEVRRAIGLPSNTRQGGSAPVVDAALIVAWHAEGLTDAEMAARSGMSVTHIAGRRWRLSKAAHTKAVAPRELSEAQLRRFHAEGLTDPQIAEKVGRACSYIWGRRRALGLDSPYRRRQATARAQAAANARCATAQRETGQPCVGVRPKPTHVSIESAVRRAFALDPSHTEILTRLEPFVASAMAAGV